MLGTRYGPVGTDFSDSRDPIFSDSRDLIFNSRDPIRVPKPPALSLFVITTRILILSERLFIQQDALKVPALVECRKLNEKSLLVFSCRYRVSSIVTGRCMGPPRHMLSPSHPVQNQWRLMLHSIILFLVSFLPTIKFL